MNYDQIAIPETTVPQAFDATFQHLIDTYAGETNKVASTWRQFTDADLGYKPHEKSSSVADILKHQLLSERRFFAEFLDSKEPAPEAILPDELTVAAYTHRVAIPGGVRRAVYGSGHGLGEAQCRQHTGSAESSRRRQVIGSHSPHKVSGG